MKVVIQRVRSASVKLVEKDVLRSIDQGLVIFLGVGHDDNVKDVKWLTRKIANLRLFLNEEGKPHYSCLDLNYPVLLVSQFTLYASCLKGARPDFFAAAPPLKASVLYETFILELKSLGLSVLTGEFGVKMEVNLCNDGPFTISIDTKEINSN